MDEVKCDKLLHDIAIGSTDAFCELYSEMNRVVFCYAISLVRNRELAADITQDVFVKIRLCSQKYVSGKNPNGWILILTRNTAFDALKKQKNELPLDFLPDDTSDFSPNDMLDNILLKEAMERLSKIERQIIMLYLVAGIPQKDIAKLLKLPVTTINWKYRSSIKKLAQILK